MPQKNKQNTGAYAALGVWALALMVIAMSQGKVWMGLAVIVCSLLGLWLAVRFNHQAADWRVKGQKLYFRMNGKKWSVLQGSIHGYQVNHDALGTQTMVLLTQDGSKHRVPLSAFPISRQVALQLHVDALLAKSHR